MPRPRSSARNNSTANLGFEASLLLAADKLRSNMNEAESKRSGDSQPKAARRASAVRQYQHTVLGLIFLKYIPGSFEEKHAEMTKEPDADAEDQDEYGEPSEEKRPRLTAELEAQFAESAKLEAAIRRHLAQFDLHP